MSFCIVEFHGIQREIAVVHKSWIVGNLCYWPPFWHSSSQLATAIKRGTNPDRKQWSAHPMHVVQNRFYGTYEEARNNLPRAEDGSEFSDEIAARNRTNQPRLVAVNDTDSDDSNDDSKSFVTPPSKKRKTSANVKLTPPPVPPTISERNSMTETTTNCLNSGSYSGGFNGNYFSRYQNGTVKSESTPPQAFPSGFATTHNYPASHSASPSAIFNAQLGPPPPTFLPPEAHGVSFHSMADPYQQPERMFHADSSPLFANDENKLLGALRHLQNGQDLLTAKMDSVLEILRAPSRTLRDSSVCFHWSLPLDSMEMFDDLENAVTSDAIAKDTLITLLSYKGGNNGNQIAHRIMAGLMTDDLMSLFTFAGQSGKLSFGKTKIMACVCGAVRKNPKGSVSSDKEIEKAVEYWMKKTGTRLKKRSGGSLNNQSPPSE